MIEWTFVPDDVARIRFGFSALAELVHSLIVLRTPGSHAVHLPWARATWPLLAELDLAELFALVPVDGDTADFLTPPPMSPLPDLAEELAAVRATPGDRLVADALAVDGVPAPVIQRLRADPARAAERIAETLSTYWQLALDPHWPAHPHAAGGGRAVAGTPTGRWRRPRALRRPAPHARLAR